MNGYEQEKKNAKHGAIKSFRRSRLGFFIQIIVPILGLVIPISLYILALSESEITVRGIQNIVLLKPDDEIVKHVEVRYQEQPIGNVATLEFEIRNTGGEDIDGKDIHYFDWYAPANTKILSAQIVSLTEGYGKYVEISGFTDNKLSLNILTLNKGTHAKLKALISSDNREINIGSSRTEAVIKGVKLLDESGEYVATGKESFMSNLLAGGLWTNIVKILIGGVLLSAVLIAIAFSIDLTQKLYKNHRIKRTKFGRDLRANVFQRLGDINHPEYVDESISYMKDLSTSQLQSIIRAANIIKEQDVKERLFNGNPLPQQDAEIIKNIPNNKKLFDILRFESLHQPVVVAEEIMRLRTNP